jgi:hypothetical protein
MLAFSPTPYTPVPEGSTVEATSTSTAVTWPATAYTTPKLCRVVVTAEAYLDVAPTPAATATTGMILVANVPELILLPPGCKMSVLAQTAGTVCFTPTN